MPTQLLLIVAFLMLPFASFAQVTPPTPPAFMQNMKSQADFDKLTPAQQKEAQEFLAKNLVPSLANGTVVAPPAGTTSCFENYRFGSVQVDITPSVASAVTGIPITFTGMMNSGNLERPQ